jgi:hypothetical protein
MSVTTIDKKAVPQSVARELSEWRFITGTILFVLAITSLPYLYAYLSAPPDKRFMGIMVNVPDHVQYFSWMRELTYANLSANKLTPEANEPIFFNLLWWGMGRLGQLLDLGYAGMFQLLRLTATTLFLLLAYRVCAWFLDDQLMRRTAFLLITFASGFGWILIGLKYIQGLADPPLPLLVFIAEPNTFLNILAFPHFVAAALYIFVFDLILRGQARGQLRYAVAAGLVALFLGWQHAYDLVLVYGILGSYVLLTLLRDRHLPIYLIKSSLILGIISWWPALYSVLLTSLDPLWQEVLAQFDNAGVFTPNPLLLPILLGPTFLLALFTSVKNNPLHLQGQDDRKLFLMTWFWANFLLVYIPTDYQIHMLNGWQMPIAILATQGLFSYIIPFAQKQMSRWQRDWSNAPVQRGVVLIFIAIVVPTNLYLLLWRFVDLSRHSYPFYLHQDEVAAMTWLEANGAVDEVVLSSLTVGQYIPAFTGKHAFLAHWAQTVDFYQKTKMVNQFFDDETSQARRQEILQMYEVDYIFYGPAEREIGNYTPASSPFLQQVYASPQVAIYQVQSK